MPGPSTTQHICRMLALCCVQIRVLRLRRHVLGFGWPIQVWSTRLKMSRSNKSFCPLQSLVPLWPKRNSRFLAVVVKLHRGSLPGCQVLVPLANSAILYVCLNYALHIGPLVPFLYLLVIFIHSTVSPYRQIVKFIQNGGFSLISLCESFYPQALLHHVLSCTRGSAHQNL